MPYGYKPNNSYGYQDPPAETEVAPASAAHKNLSRAIAAMVNQVARGQDHEMQDAKWVFGSPMEEV